MHTSTTNTIIKYMALIIIAIITSAAGVFYGSHNPNILNNLIFNDSSSNTWIKNSKIDELKKVNSQLKLENDELRERLKNSSSNAQTSSETYNDTLPDKQWIETDTPFEFLDGNVTIKIIKIYEHRTRKAASSLQVIVPLRSPFKKTRMFKGDSLEFTYLEKKYILTINNLILQDQKVQVSVREA
jgi:hypothetical protein